MVRVLLILIMLLATASVQAQSLEIESQQILTKHCYECHGRKRESDPNFNVVDHRYLTSRDLVVPGSVDKSKVMKRILDNEMPPVERPRMTPEEISTLSRWIEEGAKSWESDKREPLSSNYVSKVIGMDLLDIGPEESIHMRYLTLTDLYQDGASPEEIETTHRAITKVMNSLVSIKVQDPIEPKEITPLDVLGLVVRIDLRDYKWTAEDWRKVVEKNPYTSNNSLVIPAVGFCWLVTRGDLYYELLDIPQTELELERALGVQRDDRAVWAGVDSSPVSVHNRLLVRRNSNLGYYWKALNVLEEGEGKDIFHDTLSFKRDYVVGLFTLASGYPGFVTFINDENPTNGKRVEDVDIEAESDPTRLAGEGSKVRVAVSCIGCHTFGPQVNVRDVVRQGAIGTENELQLISRRFVPQEELDNLLEKDKQTYPQIHGSGEPYREVISRFNRPVDLQRAAAESNTTPETLFDLIRSRSELRSMGLGSLLEKGNTVTRKSWISGPAKRVTQLVKGD